jgi:PA14 domain
MKIKKRSFVYSGLNRMPLLSFGSLLLALLMSGFILAGCAQLTKLGPKAGPEKPPLFFTDLTPINPLPPAESIKGGLKVWYFDDFYFKHVDEMPKGDPPFSWGFEGKPIPILDRKYKRGEKFYDSGFHRGISSLMRGMIRFTEPGQYVLMANSNDGIRIFVGEKRVINDPDWHALGDELTPEAWLTISNPGWYRFRLKFFQRRGTATLQMFWKKPGDEDFSFIPAEAYGHIPD